MTPKTWMIFAILFLTGVCSSALLFHLASPPGTKQAIHAQDFSGTAFLAGTDSYSGPARYGNCRRIASMAPSITESLFALGCGDRVVGVTSWCTWPREAITRVKLGGTFNPDLEKLTALHPDLVITQGHSEKIVQFCRQKNIPFLQVRMSNIRTILADLEYLGYQLGCPQAAAQTVSNIRKQLQQVRNRVVGQGKPRVFLALFRVDATFAGLSTAGGGTFLNDLINMAGGINIFARDSRNYPRISKESLIQRRPDIIIEAYAGQVLSPEQIQIKKKQWQQLGRLPAVRNNRIYFIRQDDILKPGPRLTLAARKLARILHPEVFHE